MQQIEISQEVRIPYILTSSTTMETAIQNIRRLCPHNFKLASPGIITQIYHFGMTQRQFFQECSNAGETIVDTNTIAIPTFFGNINCRNWYLAIINKQCGTTNRYILDSIGYSQECTVYVHKTLSQININVEEWKYYTSI